VSFSMKGTVQPAAIDESRKIRPAFERYFAFILGFCILIFVPVFKTITHLPPFMAILFGLGIMWIIIEILHRRRGTPDPRALSVAFALRKIDTPSILFFLGILLSIAAIQITGQLTAVAQWLSATLKSETL